MPPPDTDLAARVRAGDAVSEHNHHYTFLRQDYKTTKQWDRRIIERQVIDVFFCEGCLDYRRVIVRTEEPERDGFGWREVVQ